MSSLPSSTAFLSQLTSDYPNFSFRPGKKFKFRPKSTIYYIPPTSVSDSFPLLLLHELSHALLGHFTFTSQHQRLKLESAAWEKTRSLCDLYSVPFDPSLAEAELDTYRNWLYKKSLCPSCSSVCAELDLSTLFCPLCEKIIKK